MQKSAIFLTAVILVVALAASAWAHHSFTAEFDIFQPVVVEGKITKVAWINPHIQIYVDGKDNQAGKQNVWQFESWGTRNMRQAGINREKLAAGTTVKIRAYNAKIRPNFAYLRNITFPDGTTFELWVGGAEGKPEEQK